MKISKDQVQEMRELRLGGLTYKEISEKFEVDPATVYNRLNRKRGTILVEKAEREKAEAVLAVLERIENGTAANDRVLSSTWDGYKDGWNNCNDKLLDEIAAIRAELDTSANLNDDKAN